MCFLIPGKIKSIKKDVFTVEYNGEIKNINNSLISVKKGDWVLVQNGMIVRKIPKNQALEILSLIS